MLKSWLPPIVKPWWLRADARHYFWQASKIPERRGVYTISVLLLVAAGLCGFELAPPNPLTGFSINPLSTVLLIFVMVVLIFCDRTLSRSRQNWGVSFAAVPLLFGVILLPIPVIATAILIGVLIGGLLTCMPISRLLLHLVSWWALVGVLTLIAHQSLQPAHIFGYQSLLLLIELGLVASSWNAAVQIWSLWLLNNHAVPKGRMITLTVTTSTLASSGLAFGWIALTAAQNQDAWWYLAPLVFLLWLSWRESQQRSTAIWVESAHRIVDVWTQDATLSTIVSRCLRTWGNTLDCEEIHCYLLSLSNPLLVQDYFWKDGQDPDLAEYSRNDRRWHNFAALVQDESPAQLFGDDNLPAFLAQLGHRQIINLPLRHGERHLGRLLFIRRHYDRVPWRPQDLSSWTTIQQLFSAAISSAQMATQMDWLALHDQLTQLPNSTLFNEILDDTVATHEPAGLLFLDLNHFKSTNDTLGHDVGDQLLQIVAKRLCHQVKATDTVARLHGDEFAILLHDVTGPDQLQAIAARLQQGLSRTTELPPPGDHISVSIGGLVPIPQLSALDLLRQLSQLMYVSKRSADGQPNIVGGGGEEIKNHQSHVTT